MSDTEIIIHFGLAGITALYAVILQHLHDKYTPDLVWVTVVIGNGLILGAAWIAASLGILPFPSVRTFVTLNIAAGLPIVIWQLGQVRKRTKERASAKHRKETQR